MGLAGRREWPKLIAARTLSTGAGPPAMDMSGIDPAAVAAAQAAMSKMDPATLAEMQRAASSMSPAQMAQQMEAFKRLTPQQVRTQGRSRGRGGLFCGGFVRARQWGRARPRRPPAAPDAPSERMPNATPPGQARDGDHGLPAGGRSHRAGARGGRSPGRGGDAVAGVGAQGESERGGVEGRAGAGGAEFHARTSSPSF